MHGTGKADSNHTSRSNSHHNAVSRDVPERLLVVLVYDLVHSCKFPHGVSVLATLVLCLATLGGIGFIAATEFLDLMGDETFQKGWDMLMLDTQEFLNGSGIDIAQPSEEGYYNDELLGYAIMAQDFVSQCVLVLLLTV